MTWPFPYPALRPALLAAALAAAGCSAGSHAGDPVPRNEVEAARQAAAREGAATAGSPERREVEERLLLDEEGRLLVNAMRAHGGWDAWRAAGRVSYTLVSRPGRAAASGPAAATDAAPPAKASSAPPAAADAAPPVEADAAPATASVPVEFPIDGALPAGGFLDERFLFGLAFRLGDPGLKREYLGVELDGGTGEYFEKLKVSREGAGDEEWLVAFFDRSTWFLKRALARERDGRLTLIVFSGWVEAAGLQVAKERRRWALASPHAHWQLAVPDRIERLEDLKVTLREMPPPAEE